MAQNSNSSGKIAEEDKLGTKSFPRRSFLRYAGVGTAFIAAGGVAGCKKFPFPWDFDNGHDHDHKTVNLGSGDIGILNYAYALEQLEAAFYMKVVASPYHNSVFPHEKAYLQDIRDHEIAHREFFKDALKSKAIPALEFDFHKVDFQSRMSVLATAKVFEDLGVSAYNGAGKLLKTPDYLVLAGKIVSVEARHAAYIRDIILPGSFAGKDVVDSNGLDTSRMPMDVLKMAGPYIKTKIDASNLPTS